MAAMVQPQIILLKEETDTSQGRAQTLGNMSARTAVVDTLPTVLSASGRSLLLTRSEPPADNNDKGGTTISNDGATIMRFLDILHPAAKTLVEIAKSQDSESPPKLDAVLAIGDDDRQGRSSDSGGPGRI
ncbi:hypothetical protein E2562_038359 [Oryza meyeriana var. granulata]|uniref:Uncharacterized protein n=1 Tax=Oryza meyeriana var. granulata TaxID=110450 RepID=A0A6G1FGY7_9ORYZ|nr:hypothetical protein E2562_038359 [Oryza meyeriana var. granulata]